VPDPARPQLLGLWGKPEKRIDLPLCEELHGLTGGLGDPVNVSAGIDPHVGQHRGEHAVAGGVQPRDRDLLPSQVPDGANLLGAEQLVAANMQPHQDDNGLSLVEARNHGAHIVGGDVGLTGDEGIKRHWPLDILHVHKSLGLEELFRGDIRGCKADGWTLPDSERASLRRRLRRDRTGPEARSPAVPATVSRPRKRRRVQPSACGALMEPPLARSHRAQRHVGTSVEGLGRGVNHRARGRMIYGPDTSASCPTGGKVIMTRAPYRYTVCLRAETGAR
jgi:hypothetical protein